MPKYVKENEQSFFALDPQGKEVACGEVGDFTIRQAQVTDLPKLFKTEHVKVFVKSLKRGMGLTKDSAKSHVESYFRRLISNRQEDDFAGLYVIELKGKFIGYGKIEGFGKEKGKKKIFLKGGPFEDEPTYGGLEVFLLDEEHEQLYMHPVCIAFGKLCELYGFYDHLELMQARRSKSGDVERIEIKLYGPLYDWEADKAQAQEVA